MCSEQLPWTWCNIKITVKGSEKLFNIKHQETESNVQQMVNV